MYIKKINKGGSLLCTLKAPAIGKGVLASVRRFRGTVYHVPSLQYILGEDATEEDIENVTSFADGLNPGDFIPWAVPTLDPVYYTQDREGNELPMPKMSTRMYADFDLDLLREAITPPSVEDDEPAPKQTSTRSRAKAPKA